MCTIMIAILRNWRLIYMNLQFDSDYDLLAVN